MQQYEEVTGKQRNLMNMSVLFLLIVLWGILPFGASTSGMRLSPNHNILWLQAERYKRKPAKLPNSTGFLNIFHFFRNHPFV